MVSTKVSLDLDWWPVGQGLFASGTLIPCKATPISWIYDCGTTSKDGILNSAIDSYAYRQKLYRSKDIQLAALSHFDKDHISGFIRLIGRFHIRKLLLPYIPLWQRIIIAIEQGISAEDSIFDFFLDPVTFLTRIEGGAIGEVIFVVGTGPGDVPTSPFEDPDVGRRGLDDGGLFSEDGTAPPESDEDPATNRNPATRVTFLRKGGRLIVPYLWEFVPCNDVNLAPKATPAFLSAVIPLIDTLRNIPDQRTTALEKIKKLYANHFGTSSAAKNLISLFLYSGPLGQKTTINCYHTSREIGRFRRIKRFAQMHTGDGTLDNGPRYDAFSHFYGPANRLAQSGIFQVMHHGSINNWHSGIAAKVRPTVSLFSSDPYHKKYGHPHAEVLRDFWPYNPIRVDKSNGFHFHAELAFR
ncbi:hypothetical protein [Methylocella sp. CPCC 101449]|uniref:hypothetical protein n=1 Tax=Methylocella sp. CPCC 101449 TaxID=2987531 RepID=UPI00288F0B87|nr:hypothetical protein [Methylocella sp. CPCC 101449]MDT2020828.1 hypothetical protein [Methylocella sp. CPCC 101449]